MESTAPSHGMEVAEIPSGPQDKSPTAIPHHLPVAKSARMSTDYVFLAVELDRVTFHIMWVVMLVLRLWCVLFLSWSTRLYWFVAHPYMGYYASLLGPTAVANFKPMGVLFAIVAAMHLYQVFTMVYASVQHRRLLLGPPPKSFGPDGNATCFKPWPLWSPTRLIRSMRRDIFRLFFDRHGPFGVESRYFHIRILCNEIIELVSQITQVRKASILVTKVWMNNLYVVMTVLNAWSTPLIRYFFDRRPHPERTVNAALERLTCLWVDFFLDSAAGMVIPMLIFVPYYLKFDFEAYNFELSYLYDDIWFANMVMENQQIFALTKWDFVWKMVPHLSIYGSLNAIRALMRPPRLHVARVYSASAPTSTDMNPGKQVHPNSDETTTHATTKAFDNSVSSIPESSMTKQPRTKESLPETTKNAAVVAPESLQSRRVQRFVSGLLFFGGLAVLILHAHAAWTAITNDLRACATMSRPWFATRISCSVVRFNCHMNNVTSVTNEHFATIEPRSVSALVFSHCPELRVPTVISSFHNLLGTDIYNSTLVEWSAEAAITAENHPRITYIIFVYTNMTRLPDGILQTLPDTMTDFEISVSNLTELPPDLHERWHPMSIFYVEHALLTKFPPTLQYLHVDDLSLLGNMIDELPEFDPTETNFYSLALAHTPLARLPESIGDTSQMGFLRFGNTHISEFPAWFDEVSRTASKIYVHDTPFCSNLTEADRLNNFGPDAVLSCDASVDIRKNGLYPLAIMAPRRLYNEASPSTT